MRTLGMVAFALALASSGCFGSSDGSGEESQGEGTSAEKQDGVEGPKPRAASRVYEGLEERLDLLALGHVAEVHRDGVFIDFGTPAQRPYTFGNWNTGWMREGADGETTYARVGLRGRIYFHADQKRAHRMKIRMKSYGTAAMTAYVNNTQGPSIQLGQGFQEYELTLPAEMIREGENYLLLVFGGTAPVEGEDVAAAVDWVRLFPGDSFPDGEFMPPVLDSLVSAVRVGGETRRSYVARRPLEIRQYVEVPPQGKLGFALGFEGEGKVPVAIRVSTDGQKTETVFEGEAGGEFADHLVDLSKFAGKIARLELVAPGRGAGRVAFAEPRLLVPRPTAKGDAKAPKNVIVLLIDTLRADRLKPYTPSSRVKTPALDEIAKQGTVFDWSMSPENWTKPSVASVLTGLYPQTHGARKMESVLGQKALLISEHLKANGFATGSFIANGYVSDRFGFAQGWDHYTNFIREQKNTDAEHLFREAGDWIETKKESRFFAYIQTIDPHVPYDPPDQFLKMYDARDYDGQVKNRMTPKLLEEAKRANPKVVFSESDKIRLNALYDGEITYHDHYFGKFIERLKAMGVLEDTLIVVTSDHGEEMDDHGSWGHGHSVYNELLHVPLIIHLPGNVPSGARVKDVVSTAAIPATVNELLGVPPMPDVEVPSLVPYLRGRAPARPPVAFSDFMDDWRVATAGGAKLIVRGNLTATLFDLARDPKEKEQLPVSARPITGRYLRVLLSLYTGAKDRGAWLEGGEGRGKVVDSQSSELDDVTRKQLEELGYFDHN
jgi:choline-sulfatase